MARFVITRAIAVSPSPPRPAVISEIYCGGTLTVKSVSHDIQFHTILGSTTNGKLAAQAQFDLDRPNWNVLYGSHKHFENLGLHLVSDFISLQLRLIAV